MLTLLGLPIETAFAAMLLLRGLTFWLPMLPGLWFAREELLAP
jgi:glycosyltransferase 2 family protein